MEQSAVIIGSRSKYNYLKKFKYGEMIYQVTIVLFSIWSQFMVALEYFFDVKVIRVCFVDLG